MTFRKASADQLEGDWEPVLTYSAALVLNIVLYMAILVSPPTVTLPYYLHLITPTPIPIS